jgi:hypothetical protein
MSNKIHYYTLKESFIRILKAPGEFDYKSIFDPIADICENIFKCLFAVFQFVTIIIIFLTSPLSVFLIKFLLNKVEKENFEYYNKQRENLFKH